MKRSKQRIDASHRDASPVKETDLVRICSEFDSIQSEFARKTSSSASKLKWNWIF